MDSLKLINKIAPKIKAILSQTDINYRKDLEQDMYLLILAKVHTEKFKQQNSPSFFELMSQEYY